MKPKKKKIFKKIAIVMVSGILIGGGIVLYIINIPHRDIQNTNTDYTLTNSQLISEYLSDEKLANEKYLAEDGESKVLEITGTIELISENFDGQKVVLLKEENDNAGVSCTFLKETKNTVNFKIGKIITIKGVIRLGTSYDEDLDLYENVVLDKCNVVKI